jgi:hypothetical protein
MAEVKRGRPSMTIANSNSLLAAAMIDAFAVHGYRSIPHIKLEPYSPGELAEFVDRLHPMSADRASRQ